MELSSEKTPREDEGDDVYAAQREELLALLQSCRERHAPLVVHERRVLSQDDISAVLQKIKHGHPFSRRERTALTEAGFALDKLYPKL